MSPENCGVFPVPERGVFSKDSAILDGLHTQHRVSSPPAFDGLAAHQWRLYMTTRDAKVICFGDGALE